MKLQTEQRNNSRRPCDEDINVIIAKNDSSSNPQPITARTFDISATGIGIIINTVLKKNHMVWFPKDQPNWQLPDKGVVVWSFKDGVNCRVGLEFIL